MATTRRSIERAHAGNRRDLPTAVPLRPRRPSGRRRLARLPVVSGGGAARHLGGEFMPKLEEGNFWIRATLPMSISLEQSAKYVGRMRAIVLGCPGEPPIALRRPAHVPEIEHRRLAARPPRRRHRRLGLLQHRAVRAAASRHDEWRRGITKDKLTAAAVARAARRVPGRGVQLLASDLRQRRGGDLGRQGREHGQGRSGPICASTRPTRERDHRRHVAGQGRRRTSACSARSASPNVRITPDRAAVRPLRAQRRRRRGRGPGGHRRPGGHAGLRGREALRSDRALGSGASAQDVARHPQHPDRRRPTAAQVPARPARADHARRRARRRLPRGQPRATRR